MKDEGKRLTYALGCQDLLSERKGFPTECPKRSLPTQMLAPVCIFRHECNFGSASREAHRDCHFSQERQIATPSLNIIQEGDSVLVHNTVANCIIMASIMAPSLYYGAVRCEKAHARLKDLSQSL